MPRKFEKRIYEFGTKKIEYEVYYVDDRATPAIEQAEALRLAKEAGVHSIKVSKPIQAIADNMFYPKDMLNKPNIGKSIRYIAYVSCIGPDGNEYEDLASAAPDNVDMLRCYMPEMAVKRARVRAVLLALGLKDLNADIEFVDGDRKYYYKPSNDETGGVEQELNKINALVEVKKECKRLKLGNTAVDKKAKRVIIENCFGEVKNPSDFSEQDFVEFLNYLRSLSSEQVEEIKENVKNQQK